MGGWVLARLLRLFSFVFSLVRLSFVFCFAVFPLEGWQPVDIFIHTRSPRFFQGDMLAKLTARIKTLEDAGSLSDVPARLSRITQYGFRREEDFDKYDALAMAEQLATAAKLSGHEKASTFDAIAPVLLERSYLSQRSNLRRIL